MGIIEIIGLLVITLFGVFGFTAGFSFLKQGEMDDSNTLLAVGYVVTFAGLVMFIMPSATFLASIIRC